MIDFPWVKTPDTVKVPKVNDVVSLIIYGRSELKIARVLAVSPRGTRIKVAFLEADIRPDDMSRKSGDTIWVKYNEETLNERKTVGKSFVLPWNGKKYYEVGSVALFDDAAEAMSMKRN